MMNKYFGAHRYFYNSALDFVDDSLTLPSFITTRNHTVLKDADLKTDEKWMREIPFDTRQLAVKNLIGMCKSAQSNQRNGNIKSFNLKYLAKKGKNQVFYVNKKAFNFKKMKTKKTGHYLFVNKMKSPLRFRKKMKKWLEKNIPRSNGDFPIIKDGSGRYYLCVLVKNESVEIKNRESIAALDPGVRTFQTYYSENECGKIGDAFDEQLKPLFKKLDMLESLKPRVLSKTRHAINRRCALLRTKVTNKVRDMHWKAASFLTKKYQVILIPVFQTQQIAKKSDNKWLNRYMMQLSHFSFRQRLIHKGMLNGCSVIECGEPWTSKTCGFCGNIDMQLGSKKTYSCKKCKLVIGRDVNGARNILIRSFTKYYN